MRGSQADVAVTAAAAALACAAAAAGPPAAATMVLGLALFAAPGYLLAQLLLGPATAGLERAMVAVGLAFIVPIVAGLVLYAAGVPLRRSSWLAVLGGVTLAADLALFLRRRAGRAAPFRWPLGSRRLPPWHTAAFGAAVVIAACGVGLARVGATIQPQPRFTQLWLSARGASAGTIKIGVTNDEGSTVGYRLVLLRNGRADAAWNITLANGDTWQQAVPFTGKNSLAANLYRPPDLTTPYRHVDTNGDKAPGL
jgi:uncharacterized membrane protein